MKLSSLTLWMTLALHTVANGADQGNTQPTAPNAVQSTVTTPPALKADLWAEPSLLANPVAFCIDEQGRMYLAETHRQGVGIPDNRGHAYWLEDDIAAQSIEDRAAKYHKWQLRTPLTTFTSAGEQVRLIQDTNGDGIADKSSYFAGPFNELLDGTAAGLIAKDGDIWFTCIPHLWRLRDNDGDGVADVKDKVITGFGVRDAFRGHDLHGLVWGPDGRLYFSMADRGYNIKLPDGTTLIDPMDAGRGGVFRCWPDGTGLERFAKGLRNPQELAFDAEGNLFTVDNNSDSGDQARLVHVVEGADSGWCMTFQYGTPAITQANYNRGPWNAEGLWHLREADQPAWILPPLAHFTNGPSGMVYEPGVTALGDGWRGSFFVCDFKGASANSGVWNFRVTEDGAGFKMGKLDKFLWNVLATDCDFGPDGRFYVSDFIDGWNGTGTGRVYAVSDPKHAKDADVLAIERLFKDGFADRSSTELATLLSHADMRVRLRAQYALAEKANAKAADANVRKEVFDLFLKHASASRKEAGLSVLHGVWGLGSLHQQKAEVVAALLPLLSEASQEDDVVRAQIAKTLGDAQGVDSVKIATALVKRLAEKTGPKEQAELALALSKQLPAAKDTSLAKETRLTVVKRLAENADRDLVLRHALSFALAATGDDAAMAELSHDQHEAVRLGAVLALRERLSPSLAAFLDDKSPRVSIEAARAIYDLDVKEALPALAGLLSQDKSVSASEALTLRAVNAASRVGTPAAAKLLSDWAAKSTVPDPSRREALWLLAHWAEPTAFERVQGFHRPVDKRDAAPALAALQPHLLPLLNASGKVADEALRTALALHAKLPSDVLLGLLKDDKRDALTRTETLRLLSQEKDATLPEALKIATAGNSPAELRIAAATLLAETNPQESVQVLEGVIQHGKTRQRQEAIQALATLKADAASVAVAKLMEELLAGKVAPELQLDVLEAAASFPVAKTSLDTWQSKLPAGDLLAAYQVCLKGGDAQRGREIFANNTAAQCMRCHKVAGGGGLAGPELSGVGGRSTREHLLESLINPSAKIAPGYGAAAVTLKDGTMVAGILKAEDKSQVTIQDANGKDTKIPLEQIESRTPPVSSMPPMFAILNKQEIRDLIAYLATLGKKKEEIIE